MKTLIGLLLVITFTVANAEDDAGAQAEEMASAAPAGNSAPDSPAENGPAALLSRMIKQPSVELLRQLLTSAETKQPEPMELLEAGRNRPNNGASSRENGKIRVIDTGAARFAIVEARVRPVMEGDGVVPNDLQRLPECAFVFDMQGKLIAAIGGKIGTTIPRSPSPEWIDVLSLGPEEDWFVRVSRFEENKPFNYQSAYYRIESPVVNSLKFSHYANSLAWSNGPEKLPRLGSLYFDFPNKADELADDATGATPDDVAVIPIIFWDGDRNRFVGPASQYAGNKPLYQVDTEWSRDFESQSPRPDQLVVSGGVRYNHWYLWQTVVPKNFEATVSLTIPQRDGPPEIVERKLGPGRHKLQLQAEPLDGAPTAGLKLWLDKNDKQDLELPHQLGNRPAIHPPIVQVLNVGDTRQLLNRPLKTSPLSFVVEIRLQPRGAGDTGGKQGAGPDVLAPSSTKRNTDAIEDNAAPNGDEDAPPPVADVASAEAETELIVRGRVVNQDDIPVAGAVVEGRVVERPTKSTTSDQEGRFELTIPRKTLSLALTIRDASNSKMWVGKIYPGNRAGQKQPGLDEPLTAKLSPVIESQVKVVDEGARPVHGATVVVQSQYDEVAVLTTDEQGAAAARLPGNGAPPMVMAFKSGVGYDYFSGDVRDENNYPVKNPPKLPDKLTLVLNGARTIRVKAVDSQGRPVSRIPISPWYINKQGNPGQTNFGSPALNRVTGPDGIAVFDWLPPNVNWGVTFWIRSDDYDADRLTVETAKLEQASDFEVTLRRRTGLSGRVVDSDGRSVPNATVVAKGAGMSHDEGRGQAETGADGRFSMTVPPDKAYVAHVRLGDMVGYVSPIVIRENKPVTDVEIKLAKGTLVRGEVTRGTPPMPVAQQWISLQLDLGRVPEEIELLRREGDRAYRPIFHHDGMLTGEDGQFRFVAAPGKYALFGPRQAKAHQFTIVDERELKLDFHVPRQELMQFTGVVRGSDGQPVADASVEGIYASATHARHSFTGKTDAAGRFSIERETQPAMVHVHSTDNSLAAIIEIDGEIEQRDIVLKPSFQARGRLLDGQSNSRAGATVKFGVKVHQGDKNAPWIVSFGGRTTTDEQGHYVLEHLAQGVDYDVDLERSKNGPWSQIATVHHDAATTVDLGEVRLADETGPRPLAERAATAFNNDQPLAARLDGLKSEATRDYLRIAVIVAAPESSQAQWFYRLLRGTSENRAKITDEETLRAIRSGMNDFRQMWVDATKLPELRRLIPGEDLSKVAKSALILLDADGSYLGHFEPDLTNKPDQAIKHLRAAIESQQLPDRDAAETLQQAQQRAGREGKRIFLQETASWCGPCHMLSRFIEQHRSVFDRHFVWIKIDRDRMTHGDDVMRTIRLGNSRSIPWIAILDDKGTVLGTSTTIPEKLRASLLEVDLALAAARKTLGADDPSIKLLERKQQSLNEQFADDNFGFPSEPKEIDRFLELLRATTPHLTADELDVLRTGLAGKPAASANDVPPADNKKGQ